MKLGGAAQTISAGGYPVLIAVVPAATAKTGFAAQIIIAVA